MQAEIQKGVLLTENTRQPLTIDPATVRALQEGKPSWGFLPNWQTLPTSQTLETLTLVRPDHTSPPQLLAPQMPKKAQDLHEQGQKHVT